VTDSRVSIDRRDTVTVSAFVVRSVERRYSCRAKTFFPCAFVFIIAAIYLVNKRRIYKTVLLPFSFHFLFCSLKLLSCYSGFIELRAPYNARLIAVKNES